MLSRLHALVTHACAACTAGTPSYNLTRYLVTILVAVLYGARRGWAEF